MLEYTSDSKSSTTLECNRGWLRRKAIQVALTPVLAEHPVFIPATKGHNLSEAQLMPSSTAQTPMPRRMSICGINYLNQ
jgi:hypothetical protein